MIRSRSGFFPLILILLVPACMLPRPSAGPPIVLPAEWKNAGNFPVAEPGRDLRRWWGRFDDPALDKLIAQALAASPDMAAAEARVREARARRTMVQSALFPSMDVSGSSNSRETHTDTGGQNNQTSYAASLDASWEIDWFGKNRSALEASSASLAATGENLHSVRATLAAEVAFAYATLRANQARQVVLAQNISTREETTRLADWRLQAKEADAFESSQAHSSLESARAAVPALEQSVAQGKNTLALLCGGTPGAVDGILSGKATIPEPPSALAIGIPADVLRRRPDVRMAGYQVLAAAAAVKSANAERFPSLRLSGLLSMNALSASRIFNPESTAASLIAGITAPVFDAGRLRANVLATNAVLEQNIAGYRKSVLTALSETENALIACKRSGERIARLEEATRYAREADLLGRQRYAAGEIDFTSVLDSQRTLLGLEDSLIASRADRSAAYIRLYQALGGGW